MHIIFLMIALPQLIRKDLAIQSHLFTIFSVIVSCYSNTCLALTVPLYVTSVSCYCNTCLVLTVSLYVNDLARASVLLIYFVITRSRNPRNLRPNNTMCFVDIIIC